MYKNIYILKYAGLDWLEKLKEALEVRGFVRSQMDPYVRHI